MQARQLLTLSGLAAVVLIAVGFAASGDDPGADAGTAAIRAFYVDHRSGQQVAAFIAMIAVPFLIVFAATLRSAIIAMAPEKGSLWGNVVLAGGTLAGAGFLLTAVLEFALSEAPKELDGGALQTLNVLAGDSWPAFTGGIGVLLLGAAGGLIPQTGGMRWLGFAGLVAGVVIFTPIGFAGFAASGLWVVLASVALTMQQRGAKPGLARPVVTG
jgi:hypothetical protein